jgi:hypothetical protein
MRQQAPNRSRWPIALSVLLVGTVVAVAIAAALAPVVFPIGDRMPVDGQSVAAGVIFVGSYLALAIGRIPGLSIDRAGIALVGAGLMVASGAPPLEGAYEAADGNTIALLLGMMIVVASLRLSGFFAVANAWAIAHARRPLMTSSFWHYFRVGAPRRCSPTSRLQSRLARNPKQSQVELEPTAIWCISVNARSAHLTRGEARDSFPATPYPSIGHATP